MTPLKSSRSMNITATSPGVPGSSASRTCWLNSARLASPVSGSWWAWCWSWSCRSRSSETACSRRSYCSAALALAASVSNSARSPSGEAAREPEAVREHDRADHAILAAQHAEHAVADAALLRGRRRAPRGNGAISATGGVGARRRSARSAAAGAGVDGRHRLAGGARAEAGAQRRAAVGGEQDDLGLLGVEGLERALEQALERDGDLGRLGQVAVGLVEELDLLVALALPDVGAVAEEGDQDRDQQQRRGLGPLDPEDAADERHRRAGDRDHEVHAEHLAHLVARDVALGQHDRGEDLRDRQHAAELGREQHRRPR